MRKLACICLIGIAFLAGGCASDGVNPANLTQAQLNAIETREIEAGIDESFSAASGALFDAGYTIAMSDKNAGLLTGRKGQDNTASRIWVSPYIRDTDFAISVQLRSLGPTRSAARVKTSVNGEPRVKKEAIDAFWVLMQRQVLMKAPPSETGSTSTQAPGGSAAGTMVPGSALKK